MNEKPKSIWKKSLKGPNWLWLLLIPFTFVYGVVYIGGNVPDSLKNYLGLPIYALFFSLFVTLMLLLAVKFVLWIFCWRNFKRFLFGLACFITLIALFYAEEDWRGKHDWEKFKREWEAKGEHFDFASIVPPPVPDDQNFAMTPVFDATDKLASRKWRNEHRNQHPDSRRNPWDTNLVDRLQMDVDFYGNNDWPTNGGDWQVAKLADLKERQNYYRWLAATTNIFPVAPQPQTPAQDVLLALSKYDSTVEELRQASQLPYSRFPLDYDDEDPAEILLPHLADLKRCSLVLRLRAIAELQNGESEKALDDVKLALRLADSIHTEPFIITHLVRIAILQITLQPIWEGLANHQWTDAQLAGLDSELAKLDFLADYEFSMRGERVFDSKIIDWTEQKRSRYWELADMIDQNNQPNTIKNFLGVVVFYLGPKGWFYQNEMVIAQLDQEWNLPVMDDPQQTVSPKMVLKASGAVGALGHKALDHPTPFNFFARLLLPSLGNYAEKIAYGQTSANLARVAIALERYRLAHGEFPESLDALAPQFMEKIPHDVIGGQPLHYRRDPSSQSSDAAGGQFVLYSVGWNETDDGGVVVSKNGSNGRDESNARVDIEKGDWVWRYPQK